MGYESNLLNSKPQNEFQGSEKKPVIVVSYDTKSTK